MIWLPGSLFVHFTAPVFLSNAMKLGALGFGTFLCPSSTPLPVVTNTVSPMIKGEQAERLWGNTPRYFIMSSRQITSASVLLLYFSSVTPLLPAARPPVLAQITSQRLVTFQSL